jgi:hypothetical protein
MANWDQYTDKATDFADDDTFLFLDKSDTTQSAKGSVNEATYATLRSSLTQVYWVDHSAADQGAVANNRSIKSLVDSIGTSKSATLVLSHSGTGNTTTYTLTTSETIPSNITLVIQNGAILDGAGTLTINGSFEVGPYKVFGSSITVAFGDGVLHHAYAEWWGARADGTTDSGAFINTASSACLHIRLLEGTYIIEDTVLMRNRMTLEGSSYDQTQLYLKDATDIAIIKNAGYASTWNEGFGIYALKINGNSANQSTQTEALVDIDQAYLFTIRDSYIMDSYADLIKLTNCQIAVVTRNKIRIAGANCVYLDTPFDVSITDNLIEQCSNSHYHVTVHNDHGGQNLPQAKITRNHFEGTGLGSRIGDDMSGCVVRDNSFGVHRVILADTANNNYVVHNTFYSQNPAIRLQAGTYGNTVTPNTFISCSVDIEDNGSNTAIYFVDPDETDQGVAGSLRGRSLKDLVDEIGTSRSATIVLRHGVDSGSGNTTTYTLTTSETVPSNITLKVENGAIIDGAGTLTINGPFEAGLYQCFGSSVTVAFGSGSVSEVYPEWWDVDGTADEVQINAAINSLPTTGNSPGGVVKLANNEYIIAAPIDLQSYVTLEGLGQRATVIQNNGSTNSIDIDGANVSGTYITWATVKRLRIKGTASAAYGIYLDDFEHILIEEVSVYNHGSDGIRATKSVDTRADQLTINFCRITNNLGWGLYQPSLNHNTSIRDTIFSTNGEGSDLGSASGEGNLHLYSSSAVVDNCQFLTVPNATSVVLTGSGMSVNGSKFEADSSVDTAATMVKLGESAGQSAYGANLSGCNFSITSSTANITMIDFEASYYGTVMSPAMDANMANNVTAFDGGTDSVENKIIYPYMSGNGGAGSWTDIKSGSVRVVIDGYREVVTGTVTLKPFGYSLLNSIGGAVTATLPDAYGIGQIKRIGMSDSTTSSTVTVTNHLGIDGRVITFSSTDHFVILEWNGSNWSTISSTAPIGTLADEGTPSVIGAPADGVWLTGGTTTITDFDDGYTGQIIRIIAEHSITITDGTNIFLSGSVNFDMTATDTLTLICKADNKWYEIARSDSGA